MGLSHEIFMNAGGSGNGTVNETSAFVANSGGRGPKKCFNCNKPGHYVKDCRLPLTEQYKERKARHDAQRSINKSENVRRTAWFGFLGSDESYEGIFIDSGATQHIFKERNMFKTYTQVQDQYIKGINDLPIPIEGTGSVEIMLKNNTLLTLTGVLHIPSSAANLISVSQATDTGAQFLFLNDTVVDLKLDPDFILGRKAHGKLNELQIAGTNDYTSSGFVFRSIKAGLPSSIWYLRLGHPNLSVLNGLKRYGVVMTETQNVKDCEACLRTKSIMKKPKDSKFIAKHPLELIHADLSGPFRYKGRDLETFFLTIVDSYSNFTKVIPIQDKSQSTDELINFIKYTERYFAAKGLGFVCGAVRTDHGGEFVNNKLNQFFQESGIHHQLTIPHQSFQNGKLERFHRSLQTKGRSMLTAANLPECFWPDAITTACYLMNRLPNKVKSDTSLSLFYKVKTDFSHLRVFGCIAYATIPSDLRDGKFGDTAKEMMFIGYADDTNKYQHGGYILFDPLTEDYVVSSQVKFLEERYYYPKLPAQDAEYPTISGGSGVKSFKGGYQKPLGGISGILPPKAGDVDEDNDISMSKSDQSYAESDIPEEDMESTTPKHSGIDPDSAKIDEQHSDSEPESAKNDEQWQVVRSKRAASRSPSPPSSPSVPTAANPFAPLANYKESLPSIAFDSDPLLLLKPTPASEREKRITKKAKVTPMVRNVDDDDSCVPVIEEPEDEGDAINESEVGSAMKQISYPSVNLAATAFMAAVNKGIIPMTFAQAMKLPNADEWKEAFDKEWSAIKDNETFSYSKCPPGIKPIKCKWVCSIKDTGLCKCRLVLKGFSQIKGINYEETFSPVIRAEAVRIFLATAASLKLVVHQMDVSNAFLNGKLDGEELYMEQPDGYKVDNGMVLKLNKSLYGLKQAPMVWNRTINQILINLGFKRNEAEMGLYYKASGSNIVLLGLYVDDILVASNSSDLLDEVKGCSKSAFKTKDLGPIKKFLGLNIEQHEDFSISLKLTDYINTIAQELGFEDVKGVSIPLSVGTNLSGPDVENSPEIDSTEFRSIVGKLLYASNSGRFDITYAVGVLSRNLQNPRKIHLQAAKKVVKYLISTKDLAINYSPGCSELVGYSDADYANCLKSRRSTTGFMFKFANGPITWRSKLQPTVALSTTEAEFMAVTESTKDGLWCLMVLKDLGIELKEFVIYNDNQGALKLLQHPSFHHKTKHIDTRHMFIRDHTASGTVKLEYLETGVQVADLLTKAIAAPQFNKLLDLC
ncbi:Copia protein [Wickerhamomyces ciferrii]|uniref:Copia protein n=1 Tax=Wickerhamomyces ciferrii (strain ATCC 14091 / BCRC 22168 / CBS 111 / JCM 3599 / NBRC 0793 / NRRL Y-1031 F-60-10) TaxID=1206466 RepID=K0KYB6_WICCF|nr:Copia protein [Wickerhamomyces ciferrii]CCH47072.1 Copia protein [Wickerhamomyces ciferrii]